MKNAANQFNAVGMFTDIARMLDSSHSEILGLYDENIAKIPFNSRDFKKKLTSSEIEQELTEKVQNISGLLKTTPLETMIFVAVYAYQLVHNNSTVDIRDITRFIGISELDFLPLQSSLQSLLKNGQLRIVERRRSGSEEYKVSKPTESSLLSGKPFKANKNLKIDRYKFCERISDYIEMRSDNEIETRDLFAMVETEEAANSRLSFVGKVKKLLPSVEDRTFFYEICDDLVRDNRRRAATGLDCTLSDIYDNCRSRLTVARSVMEQTHPLITLGLTELLPSAFFGDAVLTLTDKGKELFLEKDSDLFRIKGKSDKRLISPDKIPSRELFFNSELDKDLGFVRESLMDDSFQKLQERLDANSLPKGVALLFHGLPGTGKTAAAEMLAKSTGRSIYHVDIAASKTCWFGESEKLFKKIFTDYRQMCEHEERKPILLFNEADALFSRRKDVDSGNCAQTENALQNILLEEMEKLDGILIATTNLSTNLDSAFERRFLFKVYFGQPDTTAKKSIWKSKLNWLTDEDADKLAYRYNLSGGEIDNIVRKATMEEVLHGQRPDFATLDNWCKNEKLDHKKGGTIGFANN